MGAVCLLIYITVKGRPISHDFLVSSLCGRRINLKPLIQGQINLIKLIWHNFCINNFVIKLVWCKLTKLVSKNGPIRLVGVSNPGCKICSRELLFTWEDISCSFIFQFYFRNFFFKLRDFNFDLLFSIKLIWWNRAHNIFSKFERIIHYQIYLIQ